MYFVYHPTIEKMYYHPQVTKIPFGQSLYLLKVMISKRIFARFYIFGIYSVLESLKISVNFDVSRICLHDFSQKMRPYFPPTTKKICEFVSEDDGPLSVFFKLPISEISEIDDHKSVRIFIYPHSVSDVFELLKTNIRTLTHLLFSLSFVPKILFISAQGVSSRFPFLRFSKNNFLRPDD